MNDRKPCPDWVSIIVIGFLGVIALVLSVGIIYLSDVGKEPSAAMFTLAGTAMGALGSMLTNPHRQQQGQRSSDTPDGTAENPVITESTVVTTPDKPLDVTVSDEAASDAPADDTSDDEKEAGDELVSTDTAG